MDSRLGAHAGIELDCCQSARHPTKLERDKYRTSLGRIQDPQRRCAGCVSHQRSAMVLRYMYILERGVSVASSLHYLDNYILLSRGTISKSYADCDLVRGCSFQRVGCSRTDTRAPLDTCSYIAFFFFVEYTVSSALQIVVFTL